MSLRRPYRVSVEGNIGAGKTTIINYFSQFPGVETYAVIYTDNLKFYLELNVDKSEVLVFERSKLVTVCNVLVDGVKLEQVNEFVYLGSMMSRDGRIDRKIERRVTAGCKEPIHWWRNLDGYNLLDLLYKDINKWYNVFQKYVQLTRLQVQTMKPKYHDTKTMIFERSVQNNRYTFVEHAFSEGYLKGPEYEVFIQWYDWIQDNIDIEIDYIVYLRTTPEKVFERIKKRDRFEEHDIPFDYIQKLHYFHDKWLLGDSNLINKNKLLVIDADQSLENVFKQCEINKHLVISNNLVQKDVVNKLM